MTPDGMGTSKGAALVSLAHDIRDMREIFSSPSVHLHPELARQLAILEAQL